MRTAWWNRTLRGAAGAASRLGSAVLNVGDVPLILVDVHDAGDELPRIDAPNRLDADRLVCRLVVPLPVMEPIAGDLRAAFGQPREDAAQELSDLGRGIVQPLLGDGPGGETRGCGPVGRARGPEGERGDQAAECRERPDQVHPLSAWCHDQALRPSIMRPSWRGWPCPRGDLRGVIRRLLPPRAGGPRMRGSAVPRGSLDCDLTAMPVATTQIVINPGRRGVQHPRNMR